MDILSLIGIVLGLVAILGGAVAKGAGLSSLWSAAAFIIVIVGTLAAILVQTPMPTFRRAMQIFVWIVKPPEDPGRQLLAQIVGWSTRARKDGLLGLENDIDKLSDPFLRKGLQMLVDGNEPDTLRKVLEIDLNSQEQTDLAAAKVFEGMGVYAPTLGIIGAVLGLMAVMQNLADPSKLGVGIAAAFTATIYGIASANLFFLPVAAKLKAVIRQRARTRELVIEGLIAIAEGENPRNLESRLQGYLL
ncbi:flagellar motor protein [Aquimonas voraii]|uniref:Chemotaxis protein MotA n=1 Tax=Aquimonas voraii TaxID=265719 RepID=A0A1G6W8I0_9GAMM|nr:flagellar motor protein [Aquimonas voraii]SDD61537.1 chemotaxis protein MotA [Aquimonas voraii]